MKHLKLEKAMRHGLVFVLALLVSMTAWAQDADTGGESTKITVGIECGGQGVVDKDWKMEFDIIGPDGKPVTAEKVVVTVPDGTGSRAAAKRIARAINMNTPGSNPASTAETDHQHYNSKVGKTKAEDVVITGGYTIGNVKTWRGEDVACGHLKIYSGDTLLNKKKRSRTQSEIAVPFPPYPVLPVPPHPYYDENTPVLVRIDLIESTANTLGVNLILQGTHPDGTPYVEEFDNQYPADVPLEDVATELRQWVESLGIPCTQPNPKSLIIDFTDCDLPFERWSFSAFDLTGMDGVIFMPSQVHFNAHLVHHLE